MRKLLISIILAMFLANTLVPPAFAQILAKALDLPVAGTMVDLSPAFVPPVLKGMSVDAQHPFKFEFILDTGSAELSDDNLNVEANKLIRYFLASMTIPEKDMWVNLSPLEQDRIITDEFSLTEMGRDMLAQDYILKQITATLLYPESDSGKAFWSKVYAKAQALYGATDIPTDTFNKVWIVPNKAEVYEDGAKVFVTDASLKVMLDTDYMAANAAGALAEVTDAPLARDVMREVVIPILEKEVNEGANFASLRQAYYSMILDKWYKETLKDSIFNRKYVDQKKMGGVDLADAGDKQQIYARYLEALKKGVFNYVKDERDLNSQEPVARKYFSGGVNFAEKVTLTRTRILSPKIHHLKRVKGDYARAQEDDKSSVDQGKDASELIFMTDEELALYTDPKKFTPLSGQGVSINNRPVIVQTKDIVDVPMNGFAIVRADSPFPVISTALADPCFITIVFDPVNQIGAIAHFPSVPFIDLDQFILDEMKRDLPEGSAQDLSRFEVTFIGGRGDIATEHKRFLADVFKLRGIDKIIVEKNTEGQLASAALDVRTSKIYSVFKPYASLFWGRDRKDFDRSLVRRFNWREVYSSEMAVYKAGLGSVDEVANAAQDDAQGSKIVDQLTLENIAGFAEDPANEVLLPDDMELAFETKYGVAQKIFGMKAVVDAQNGAVRFFNMTTPHTDVALREFKGEQSKYFGIEFQVAALANDRYVVVAGNMESRLMFQDGKTVEDRIMAWKLFCDAVKVRSELTENEIPVSWYIYEKDNLQWIDPGDGRGPKFMIGGLSKDLRANYYKSDAHQEELAGEILEMLGAHWNKEDGMPLDQEFKYGLIEKHLGIVLSDNETELKKYQLAFNSKAVPSDGFDQELKKKIFDYFVVLRHDMNVLITLNSIQGRSLWEGRHLSEDILSAVRHQVSGSLAGMQMLMSADISADVLVEILHAGYREKGGRLGRARAQDDVQRANVADPFWKNDLGGIDLNAEKVDLERSGTRAQFDWNMSDAELESVQISGLSPVISAITPLDDLVAVFPVVK